MEAAQPADADRSLVSHVFSRTFKQAISGSDEGARYWWPAPSGPHGFSQVEMDYFFDLSIVRSCIWSSDHVGRKCVSDVISSARFLGERESEIRDDVRPAYFNGAASNRLGNMGGDFKL